MEPLQLLVVSIKTEWRQLIENSLKNAGYRYHIEYVESKQQALQACRSSKFDILISNCNLPDGQVTDMAAVLGNMVPCLVMSQNVCPVTSDFALGLPDTNYYISCSEQTAWLTELENTIARWEVNAKKKLEQQHQIDNHLYKKVLTRCEEELTRALNERKTLETAISGVLTLLLEILDLSRISICKKKNLPDGTPQIRQTIEILAPGIGPAPRSLQQEPRSFPFFNRWNSFFSLRKAVVSHSPSLSPREQKWLNQRDTQSFLAVPLSYGGQWHGLIALEDTLKPRQWSDADVKLMESVAQLFHKKHLSPGKSELENSIPGAV